MSAIPSSDHPTALASLRGLRTAPSLDANARQQLRQELEAALSRCQWFTIGVMAANREAALTCLRSLESSRSWLPLQEEGEPPASGEDGDDANAAVFLKGNQRTGGFRVRLESGLGEGLLITGHNADAPEAEDTWGPLPLDLFS